MPTNECSPFPPGVWHRTRTLGGRGWITFGHTIGKRTRIVRDSTFAAVMVRGYYLEFGWR